jgi:hypothetical protein
MYIGLPLSLLLLANVYHFKNWFFNWQKGDKSATVHIKGMSFGK